MKNEKVLFEFLYSLIAVQIDKAVRLATIGIGPDARLNARLVKNEVDELLQLGEQLLSMMASAKLDQKKQFTSIFNQIRFYIEQEYLRGYSGWLIAENNPHNVVYERTTQQKEQLAVLAQQAEIDITAPAQPQTEIQRQCEWDSHAIAFFILNLAVTLIKDPAAELDPELPPHAVQVMREHAVSPSGRYHQEPFSTSIRTWHKKCNDFMQSGSRQKSQDVLLSDEANIAAKKQKDVLQKLHERYQAIHAPSAVLTVPKSESSLKKFSMYAVVAIPVVSLLVCYLIKKQGEAVSISNDRHSLALLP
jgi:hypothetical protein